MENQEMIDCMKIWKYFIRPCSHHLRYALIFWTNYSFVYWRWGKSEVDDKEQNQNGSRWWELNCIQTYFKTSQGVLHTHLELSCETEKNFKIKLIAEKLQPIVYSLQVIGQFLLTNRKRVFLKSRLNNLIFLRHICIDLVNIQDCSSIFADRDTGDPGFADLCEFYQYK